MFTYLQPFARNYGREVDDAVRQGIISIMKAVFLPLLQSARDRTFTPDSIIESFISTGLIPFNPAKVLDRLPNLTDITTDIPPLTQPCTPPRTVVLQRPTTPKTPETTTAVKDYISSIFDQHPTLTPPVKRAFLQIGKATEVSMAKESIQQEKNAQLRAASFKKKKSDKWILSKACILSAEEAHQLRY
ncbi:hypothetical protein BGX38DRAFT_1270206 [Terfezia claveryi]|nr:hypothetical protein BGX38DRAFT_1270206 [Terfezia claveryi]